MNLVDDPRRHRQAALFQVSWDARARGRKGLGFAILGCCLVLLLGLSSCIGLAPRFDLPKNERRKLAAALLDDLERRVQTGSQELIARSDYFRAELPPELAQLRDEDFRLPPHALAMFEGYEGLSPFDSRQERLLHERLSELLALQSVPSTDPRLVQLRRRLFGDAVEFTEQARERGHLVPAARLLRFAETATGHKAPAELWQSLEFDADSRLREARGKSSAEQLVHERVWHLVRGDTSPTTPERITQELAQVRVDPGIQVSMIQGCPQFLTFAARAKVGRYSHGERLRMTTEQLIRFHQCELAPSGDYLVDFAASIFDFFTPHCMECPPDPTGQADTSLAAFGEERRDYWDEEREDGEFLDFYEDDPDENEAGKAQAKRRTYGFCGQHQSYRKLDDPGERGARYRFVLPAGGDQAKGHALLLAVLLRHPTLRGALDMVRLGPVELRDYDLCALGFTRAPPSDRLRRLRHEPERSLLRGAALRRILLLGEDLNLDEANFTTATAFELSQELGIEPLNLSPLLFGSLGPLEPNYAARVSVSSLMRKRPWAVPKPSSESAWTKPIHQGDTVLTPAHGWEPVSPERNWPTFPLYRALDQLASAQASEEERRERAKLPNLLVSAQPTLSLVAARDYIERYATLCRPDASPAVLEACAAYFGVLATYGEVLARFGKVELALAELAAVASFRCPEPTRLLPRDLSCMGNWARTQIVRVEWLAAEDVGEAELILTATTDVVQLDDFARIQLGRAWKHLEKWKALGRGPSNPRGDDPRGYQPHR